MSANPKKKLHVVAASPTVGALAHASDTLNTLARLRALGVQSIAEASVLYVAAVADFGGSPETIVAIARKADLPMSTASRLIFDLYRRGMVVYENAPGDRRKKLIRVKPEVFE